MRTYVAEKDAILHNLQILTKKADGTHIWAVLKGNGYGLGAGPMAELCRSKGITRFAVTEISEAIAIRKLGGNLSILMLRPTKDPVELQQMLDLDVIATIGSTEDAAALNAMAGQRGIVAEAHVKIDTGMGRYGFHPDETGKILSVYRYNDALAVSGIYTHFHSAFCDEKATQAQYEQFRMVISSIEAAGIEPGAAHCCNSEAFLRHPEMKMQGVRLGSALLGRVRVKSELRRVGFCEATVDEIRWLPAGHTTGYGAGWKAKKPTQIAVISVGWYHGFTASYGDDLSRFRDRLRAVLQGVKRLLLPKRIYVTINGQKCRVLGHVGMLHTVCNVTKASCRVGDKVELDINPLMLKDLEIRYR